MKKIPTTICALLVSLSFGYAQPTLSEATNSPVPGDGFVGYVVDTLVSTGLTHGPSGPAVTWSYPTLSILYTDTTYFTRCPTTPFCDSFPTSNIASGGDSDYDYEISNISSFSALGYVVGTTVTHIDGNNDILVYPFTYNSTHKDTSSQLQTGMGFYAYTQTMDSFIADGYGTLILPTGTYANVLRIHRTTLNRDTFNFAGTPIVSLYQTESYQWYDTSGFHSPLFVLEYDTAGIGYPYITNAEYYTTAPPLGVGMPVANEVALSVSPNPASDIINVNFYMADTKNTMLTLSDMVGRVFNAVNWDNMGVGMNTFAFSAAAMPPGVYIVRLQSPSGNISRKVVVEK